MIRITTFTLAFLALTVSAFGDGWLVETIDSAGDIGYYPSLVLDGDNNAHISYIDHTNENLKYTYRDGSTWNSQAIDSVGANNTRTSIDLDSNGYPHIS